MTDVPKEIGSNANAAVTEGGAEPRASSTSSTLIEFPGTRIMPHWRKELKERVREIQQRKAQEVALKGEQSASDAAQGVTNKENGAGHTHLGLVPSSPTTQKLNPVVAAALARIERGRQRHTSAWQQTPPASASREVIQTSTLSESTSTPCVTVQDHPATLVASEAVRPDEVTAPARQSPVERALKWLLARKMTNGTR